MPDKILSVLREGVMKKPIQEIIRSLRDQARDKEALANGDADSIFAQDAKALCKAIDLLEKLIAERDEYKRRSEAAEADILEMLIEEGGNLDLCHWCAGNCPDNDYSQCDQKIRWRGPCAQNGGV